MRSTSFIAALADAPRKESEPHADVLASGLPERFDHPYRTRAWTYERQSSSASADRTVTAELLACGQRAIDRYSGPQRDGVTVWQT